MPAGGTGRPIVVGVDGSEFSKAALTWAIGQAERTGDHIQAVITWIFPANLAFAPALPEIDFAADARDVLAATVTEVAGDHAAVQIEQVVLEGHAALVLAELSNTADLVVVGSRGHGAFVGMVLGSVSAHVVAHAHCPVVVVHTPAAA